MASAPAHPDKPATATAGILSLPQNPEPTTKLAAFDPVIAPATSNDNARDAAAAAAGAGNKGEHERKHSAPSSPPPSQSQPAHPPDVMELTTMASPAGNTANVALREDVPPNGGYGWVCTACVMLMNANTWGVNAAWAIFLAHYLAHSTFAGATQLHYALIGGLSISQALMVSPVTAASSRWFGTKTTLLVGSVLVSMGWLTASFATEVWHLFVTVGACFGWGMGMVYITASAILPQWFSSRRSLAVGIAASGAGIGGLFYNLLAGWLVQSVGVSWTYRVLACTTIVINGISSILLKDRNKFVKPVQGSFNYREFGHVEVLLIVAWGFLTDIGYVVLLFSLPHYATSIGLSQTQGSIVGAMLNLGMAIGRPLIGYYSDTLGRLNMAGLMTALCGILCLAIWVPANSFGVLLLFAIPAGAVTGIFWGTITAVTAEVVGLQRLPTVFGIICVALVTPTTFAEPIGLEIVSAAGFLTSQVFVGCLYLLGAAFVLLLRTWKISEIKAKAALEAEDEEETTTRAMMRAFKWLTPRSVFVLQRV